MYVFVPIPLLEIEVLDGFRKVSPLDKGGLTRSESDQDHLEFSHTCFIRGRPDLMVNIKRRVSRLIPPLIAYVTAGEPNRRQHFDGCADPEQFNSRDGRTEPAARETA